MSDELTPIDEQAFDFLLSEAHGGGNPPDLSGEILARLRDERLGDEASVVSIRHTPVTLARSDASKLRYFVAAAVVAGLAASFLIGVWLRGNPQGEGVPIADTHPDRLAPPIAGSDVPKLIAEADAPDVEAPDVEAMVQDDSDEENVVPKQNMVPKSKAPLRNPPRGIPLLVDSKLPADTDRPDDQAPKVTPRIEGTSEPVMLVSQQIDADLLAYWQAIGIEPTDAVSGDDWSARWMDTLGIELSPDSIADAERLRAELANPRLAKNIARRWLTQITDGGIARLDEQQREALIDEVATCVRGEQRLDQTLAMWIGGQGEKPSAAQNSSAFYSALASGKPETSGRDTMTRRLASLSMNVDLRCTRCHDALIEGTGRQEDYWSFAAFLQRGVKRTDGRWVVNDQNDSAAPVFYELPDGRQRVVEPGIASSWLSGSERVTNLHEFSQRIVGTESLAGGVVNSLWQLVHGRPLRGRVIDAISAPHNDSLEQLERRLTEDLVRSGFDVRRTLALIMTSPATRRSVPTPLTPENALVANAADVQRAMDAVDAFAAALPAREKLSMSGRLDLAMRSIGAKLDDLSGIDFALAQIGDEPAANKPSPTRKPAPSGFPKRSVTSLPVQWLERVEGYETRVEHLGYLAGLNQIPNSIREAADAMQATDEVSDELLLHRVWWLLSP